MLFIEWVKRGCRQRRASLITIAPDKSDGPGRRFRVTAKGSPIFETQAALAAFRETELAQTIASAYEVTEIRQEVYDLLYPLHPERGPLPE